MIVEQPPTAAQSGARRFVDPLGNDVLYDGTSPVTWRVAANVLVVRDGKVLMVRQPHQWGGRWELPGGGLEPVETLLQGAARECYEETGYRFVASSTDPFHVEEAWFKTSRGTYCHALTFIFRGSVPISVDPVWIQDTVEIVGIAWIDPKDLSPDTTRTIHWPALQKAGLV